MTQRKPYLPSLSSARFPPALEVVTFHVIIAYHVIGRRTWDGVNDFQSWCLEGSNYFNHFLGRSFLFSAAITLSFFFTLSGFVLSYTYLLGGPSPKIDRREFWVNRLARIYPVYILALLVSLPIYLIAIADHHPPYTEYEVCVNTLASLTLMQSWSPESALAWNPPGWSLSCEVFFYLLFPWMVLIIDRLSNRALVATMAACWILSLTPPLLYQWFNPDGIGEAIWTSDGYWLYVLKFNPIIRLPEFVSGVALGKLYLRRRARDNYEPNGKGARLTLAALVIVLVVTFTADLVPFMLLHNGLLTPVFAVLIYGLALGGGPIARFLERPTMVLLGDATYGLYILHFAIISYGMVIIAVSGGKLMGPMTFLFVVLAVGTLLSVRTYRRYEVPGRKLIRKWLSPRPATPAAPGSPILDMPAPAPLSGGSVPSTPGIET